MTGFRMIMLLLAATAWMATPADARLQLAQGDICQQADSDLTTLAYQESEKAKAQAALAKAKDKAEREKLKREVTERDLLVKEYSKSSARALKLCWDQIVNQAGTVKPKPEKVCDACADLAQLWAEDEAEIEQTRRWQTAAKALKSQHYTKQLTADLRQLEQRGKATKANLERCKKQKCTKKDDEGGGERS